MCDKFSITLIFKEICIQNLIDDLNNGEIKISLELLNSKIEHKCDTLIFMKNACQILESIFVIQADGIDDDDFIFSTLGTFLEVTLTITKALYKKPQKKRKTIENLSISLHGEINLLHQLMNPSNNSFVMMDIYDDMEIALSFEIFFQNPPSIPSLLSIEINGCYNLNIDQKSSIEACTRFPFNNTFRAGIMKKSQYPFEIKDKLLIDDFLKMNAFELLNPSKMNVEYKNFQSENGIKFFHQLIETKQSLLIELKIGSQMMMTLINFDIFNYPGVHDINFVAPLYEWNKHIIKKLFQQDAHLKEDKLTGKKLSMKMKNLESSADEQVLKPILDRDENIAAISVRIHFSKPMKDNFNLEDLVNELNSNFNFIRQETDYEKCIRLTNKNFEDVIDEIRLNFEKKLDENQNLQVQELRNNLEAYYNKEKLKDAVQRMIGNIYNQETKTETNHEFKLLMINVYKELNRKIVEILERKDKLENVSIDKKLIRIQIEEWLIFKNTKKVEEILGKIQTNADDVDELKDLAFYQLKLQKFEKCQETALKILKIDTLNPFAFYLLSYLLVVQNDYDTAAICMKVLTILYPESLEFWLLLSSFYEKIESSFGVKFCRLQMKNSKFISIYEINESLLHPLINFDSEIAKVYANQLNLNMTKFSDITKEELVSDDTFETKILSILEKYEKSKFDEGLHTLKLIPMSDENEFTLRVLKGNLLYSISDAWRAICEYEIAYNLSIKAKTKFPLAPALRMAFWFLFEIENLSKARRYFHYCCKNFGTFNSFNGNGIVCLREKNYANAEKYLNCANQIDKNDAENWLYLALLNKLQNRMNISLKCYWKAKNLNVKRCEILNKVEKALQI